ncbi:hypothetical protein AVL48_05420 [Amycolatopsis regifaucium]|uniref:Uncharacterized protein n=1 Tax=Amycolatopsis regifaucium TaxID=546365 RepID=A0A154MAT0_9PSEU|nr:hypothetical protein AVL48_05420 [Amycolatopsis regifaucium]OKA04716.1 hypothetical protein ATP06_0230435 [Amycolatopsis regifaucium]
MPAYVQFGRILEYVKAPFIALDAVKGAFTYLSDRVGKSTFPLDLCPLRRIENRTIATDQGGLVVHGVRSVDRRARHWFAEGMFARGMTVSRDLSGLGAVACACLSCAQCCCR